MLLAKMMQTTFDTGTLLPDEKQSPLRMPELDGLRGIAILLVLIYHYIVDILVVEPGSTGAFLLTCVRLSWSGVDLFFVLSGFLIGGILMDNRLSQNFFQVFYIRRICRIFPIYFFWLFLFCGLLLAAHFLFLPVNLPWLLADPLPLWSYATFSQNFLMSYHESFGPNWMGVTWSLAVEEQFYCILPLIIRYSAPRKLPWLFVGLIVAAPLLRAALSFAFPNGRFAAYAAYTWMPCRADSLLLGALCAWSVRQKRMVELLEKRTKNLYAVLVILLTGAAVLSIVMSYGWPNLGYTWLALLYTFFLLIAITEKRGFLQKIAAYSLLRRLGVIAYGVYLLHQGVLGLAHGLILGQAPLIRDIQDLIVSMFALVLTLVLANISWIHFEKPIVAKGHGFRYAVVTPSIPPAGIG